jgi:hypothetical protein
VGRTRDLLIGAFIALLSLAAAAVFSPPAAAASHTTSITDSVLTSSAVRTLAGARASTDWGGAIRATDGETVTIYFSDSYPVDQALALKWADFMTSLVHGSELSTVTIYLAPLAEVQRYCGRQAIACYSPDGLQIVAPADAVDAQTSAEGVLTHEYGHHIAESRLNPPFTTVEYGTKRWASYENVCARTNSGELFPGAEDEQHYTLNPGEAFAESYRVLNEQKLGAPVEAWNIVSSLLYPDATALALLEQDVTQPWAQSAATRLSITLTKSIKTKSFVISTPYDGTLSFAPAQSGAARVSLAITDSNGASLATRTLASRTATPISTTVCGQRTYTARVKLTGTVTKKTKTTFTLAVTKP